MSDADPSEEIDTLRGRLRSGERYVQYDADRTHLLRMSDNMNLVPSQIGDYRHLKLLRHTSRMAQLAPPPTVQDFRENDEAGDYQITTEDDVETVLEEHGLLGLALESRAAAEAVVRWIHSEYDNEHTNQDYRTALRSFGRYRLKRDEPPESLAWIPTETSNDFDPTPSERDLLDFEVDIEPMLEGCRNARDEALIAVQFEAGLRGGELYDLKVGDVFDAEHTVGLHVDGKEGERTVHLIRSIPYLNRWLSRHPTNDDGDWLWSKLNSAERPSYNTFLGYFKQAADRAGVSKDVTPTNFRKSNTRYLILLGMQESRINQRQGRKPNSDHTSRYVATFGDESNETNFASLHGMEVETDEPEATQPVTCPRCGRETPRDEPVCMWCQQALDPTAVETLDERRKDLTRSALDAEEDVQESLETINDELEKLRSLGLDV